MAVSEDELTGVSDSDRWAEGVLLLANTTSTHSSSSSPTWL